MTYYKSCSKKRDDTAFHRAKINLKTGTLGCRRDGRDAFHRNGFSVDLAMALICDSPPQDADLS